jgi:hypothetical protein
MALKTRGKIRELTDEELSDMKSDLRWLIDEGGWSYRALNQALGFQLTSNMLRNITGDAGNKFSTTRARYNAVKRIREESLKPGITLITETTSLRKKKGAAAPAPESDAPRRGRRPRAASEDGIPATPAPNGLSFKMSGTEFSALPQEDGSWRVVLTTNCTTAQMLAWTQQVLSGQLTAVSSEDTPAED